MKRYKRYKDKTEWPETSTSHTRDQEEHDLAHYIHDRVELMHQVFSVLKYKELKAMAPACIRNISLDDLQELCTEELLGISSKRLCAILDGADTPSDTESSSQSPTEALETISLDSISSDEEILSQEGKNKKKKHKHRRRDTKSKSKTKKQVTKAVESEGEADAEKSRASRAGLTVLELLELQARARAIRAQLQKEQTKPPATVAKETAQSSKSESSADEVEIKEEPAVVVEISSDEEKPKVEELETSNGDANPESPEPPTTAVTKRVNDLVITVPLKKIQKIKLNRNKYVSNANNTTQVNENTINPVENVSTVKEIPKDNIPQTVTSKDNVKKDKTKDKSKKKKKKKLSHVSDNDEITLQLSDSEKMDLLEDLDRKNYDNVSSSCPSSDSDEDSSKNTKKTNTPHNDKPKIDSKPHDREIITPQESKSKDHKDTSDSQTNKEDVDIEIKSTDTVDVRDIKNDSIIGTVDNDSQKENKSLCSNKEAEHAQVTSCTSFENIDENISAKDNSDVETVQVDEPVTENFNPASITQIDDKLDTSENIDESIDQENNKNECQVQNSLSEGEISDRESSEVEAFDFKPEVVCISDEEKGKSRKKKKKKEKKSKKDKKSKKKSRENEIVDKVAESSVKPIKVVVSFPTESEESQMTDTKESLIQTVDKDEPKLIETVTVSPENKKNTDKNLFDLDNPIEDDIPHDIVEISDEIYELSDDSSNYDEGETKNVLSKEPTASEIEALSAKIDEIERVEVITDEQIKEYESKQVENEEINVSWKDRYLDSKRVRRVLNTSNILNALRKKNRELKKKLEKSKVELELKDKEENINEIIKDPVILEGSIEQYNTLEGSNAFVDPVKETEPETLIITKTLKKDAEQLLKMYRKLLKYNDMNRKKDPTKKKKKKKKNKKEKEKEEDK